MQLQPNSASSSVAERMEAINACVAVQSLQRAVVVSQAWVFVCVAFLSDDM